MALSPIERKGLTHQGGTQSLTLTFANQPQEGELLVLFVVATNSSNYTWPEGFSDAHVSFTASSRYVDVRTKRAGPDEATSFTITKSGSGDLSGMIFRMPPETAEFESWLSGGTNSGVATAEGLITAMPAGLNVPAGAFAVATMRHFTTIGTVTAIEGWDEANSYRARSLRKEFATAESDVNPWWQNADWDSQVFASLFVAMVEGGASITGLSKLQAGKSLTINGTSFGAAQGTNGAVILSPAADHEHVDAETQAITSWGATEIVTDGLTLPDGLGAGDAVYVFVVDDLENVSDAFPTTVADPAIRISLRDIDTGVPKDAVTYATVLAFAPADRTTIAVALSNVVADEGTLTLRNAAFSIDEIEDEFDLVGWTGDGTDRFHATGAVVDLNDE